jgi:Ca2+-binding EF-hand superfamily protein
MNLQYMSSESTREAFKAADTDGDGCMSYQEFKDSLGMLTNQLSTLL